MTRRVHLSAGEYKPPVFSTAEAAEFVAWCATVQPSQARARLDSAIVLELLTGGQIAAIRRAIAANESRTTTHTEEKE